MSHARSARARAQSAAAFAHGYYARTARLKYIAEPAHTRPSFFQTRYGAVRCANRQRYVARKTRWRAIASNTLARGTASPRCCESIAEGDDIIRRAVRRLKRRATAWTHVAARSRAMVRYLLAGEAAQPRVRCHGAYAAPRRDRRGVVIRERQAKQVCGQRTR